MGAAVHAENLVKRFAENEILKGINIDIADGEFVSIMGASGSGKSTFLNIVAGNERADEGVVMIDGVDILKLSDKQLSQLRRTTFGYVYQFFNLVSTLTAKENIILPMILNGKKKTDCKDKLEYLTKTMGLDGILDRYPSELSGGEQQKVAIARSMIYEPQLLLLDEPTGNLDSISREEIMKLLVRLNKELNVTIVQVTHDAETATYGSRVVRMIDGKLVD